MTNVDNVNNKSGHNTGPDLLCINKGWMGRHMVKLDVVDSTNLYVKNYEEKLQTGTVVIAKAQTAGRGRLSRGWSSPNGEGIWMSYILRPDIEPSACGGLTLVTALALTKVLKRLSGLNLQIKWPNDIVCNGKKLAGILTELSLKDMKTDYVVVGIGVNVSTTKFPDDISRMATSLKLEGAVCEDIDLIVKEFCEEFEKCYEAYMATGDMKLLKEEYQQLLVNIGREVCILKDDKEFIAEAIGINDEGELLVKKESEITTIRAGEVSVRGIYGYV